MTNPGISDAQWEIMNVIWASHPITASEVIEKLQGHNDWSPRTIKTMLGRLLKKGVLTHDVEGKRYLYRPALTKEECIHTASETFLGRVFGGSVGPMVVNLVRNANLSADEIDKLRSVLEDKERGKDS